MKIKSTRLVLESFFSYAIVKKNNITEKLHIPNNIFRRFQRSYLNPRTTKQMTMSDLKIPNTHPAIQ